MRTSLAAILITGFLRTLVSCSIQPASSDIMATSDQKILFKCSRIDVTHSGVEALVLQDEQGQVVLQYSFVPGTLLPGMTVPPPQLLTAKGKILTNTAVLFKMSLDIANAENSELEIRPLDGTRYAGALLIDGSKSEVVCKKN